MKNLRRGDDKGALLVIDVDFFKKINDNFGHQKGDIALIEIAASLEQTIRKSDLSGRPGGEEFAVFLSKVNSKQAIKIAEKMRRAVEQIQFEGLPTLTISVGIVMARGGENISELVNIADQRMYLAKRNGRNRVVADGAREATKSDSKLKLVAA